MLSLKCPDCHEPFWETWPKCYCEAAKDFDNEEAAEAFNRRKEVITMEFSRHEGRYYHEECAPVGATDAATTDFDDDEICGECGAVLVEDEDEKQEDDLDIPEEEVV